MGAWDMLTATTKVERLRDRHRDYYLELVEQAEPELRGPDQVAWLDLMEAEHDNLREAFEWSLSNGDADPALRMAVALERFWQRHPIEGVMWLDRAASADTSPSVLRAHALAYAGEIGIAIDPSVAAVHIDEALLVAREVDDKAEIARALIAASFQVFGEGSYEKARFLADEALGIARDVGDRSLTARASYRVGMAVAQTEGSASAGSSFIEEAVALDRESGDKRMLAESVYTLAWMDAAGPAEQKALQQESLQLCRGAEGRHHPRLGPRLSGVDPAFRRGSRGGSGRLGRSVEHRPVDGRAACSRLLPHRRWHSRPYRG